MESGSHLTYTNMALTLGEGLVDNIYIGGDVFVCFHESIVSFLPDLVELVGSFLFVCV